MTIQNHVGSSQLDVDPVLGCTCDLTHTSVGCPIHGKWHEEQKAQEEAISLRATSHDLALSAVCLLNIMLHPPLSDGHEARTLAEHDLASALEAYGRSIVDEVKGLLRTRR